METGPLARIMIAYALGRKDVKKLVDDTLAKLKIPLSALHSALGRTIARGLESVLIAKWMREDMDQLLANIKNGNQVTFNAFKMGTRNLAKKVLRVLAGLKLLVVR